MQKQRLEVSLGRTAEVATSWILLVEWDFIKVFISNVWDRLNLSPSATCEQFETDWIFLLLLHVNGLRQTESFSFCYMWTVWNRLNLSPSATYQQFETDLIFLLLLHVNSLRQAESFSFCYTWTFWDRLNLSPSATREQFERRNNSWPSGRYIPSNLSSGNTGQTLTNNSLCDLTLRNRETAGLNTVIKSQTTQQCRLQVTPPRQTSTCTAMLCSFLNAHPRSKGLSIIWSYITDVFIIIKLTAIQKRRPFSFFFLFSFIARHYQPINDRDTSPRQPSRHTCNICESFPIWGSILTKMKIKSTEYVAHLTQSSSMIYFYLKKKKKKKKKKRRADAWRTAWARSVAACSNPGTALERTKATLKGTTPGARATWTRHRREELNTRTTKRDRATTGAEQWNLVFVFTGFRQKRHIGSIRWNLLNSRGGFRPGAQWVRLYGVGVAVAGGGGGGCGYLLRFPGQERCFGTLNNWKL